MSDRIEELENIAEECERAAEDDSSRHMRGSLAIVAAYFRSKARILSKVRREKE